MMDTASQAIPSSGEGGYGFLVTSIGGGGEETVVGRLWSGESTGDRAVEASSLAVLW